MSEPPRLVTTKPDAEIAEEIRREMIEAHKLILALLDRARAQGFLVNVSCAVGPLNSYVITQLQVLKQF